MMLVVVLAACQATPSESELAQEGGVAVSSVASSAVAATCEVSELLVPSCGAWFGASTPSADGRYDYRLGLDEYESLARNTPDILRFYHRGGEAIPTDEERSLSERPGQQRSLLFLSWKPDPTMTWRQIADGGADASIESVAGGLRAYPFRLFLAIHHEPENDVVDTLGSGMTPEDYVDMYRYVVGKLRTLGVDNVVYVMNYMGFERWATIVDRLYPGHDVVDWVAYDPYALSQHVKFADALDDPDGGDWPGFYSWVIEKVPEKPIMAAEWGVDPELHPDATRLIEGLADTMSVDFDRIKALIYWNNTGKKLNPQLRGGSDRADLFSAAFRRLAEDPYFNSTDPGS